MVTGRHPRTSKEPVAGGLVCTGEGFYQVQEFPLGSLYVEVNRNGAVRRIEFLTPWDAISQARSLTDVSGVFRIPAVLRRSAINCVSNFEGLSYDKPLICLSNFRALHFKRPSGLNCNVSLW